MQSTIRIDKAYPVLTELPKRAKKQREPEKKTKGETFQDVLEQLTRTANEDSMIR